MYILLWNNGAYETYNTFMAMLHEMKNYNKAGLFKNIDYTWQYIENYKPAVYPACIGFDEF